MFHALRTSLLVSAVAPLLFAQTPEQPSEKLAKPASSQVVFVCEHGAAKSVIAAAYFNKLAQERGLGQRAIARGTRPDDKYSPAAVQGLQADGIPVEKGKPVLVTDSEVAKATQVVTLGCQLPDRVRPTGKVDQWDQIPSVSDDYPAAREAIKKRVEQLVKELAERKEH
jgi:protein-tyrosine-phosphatase